MEPLYIQHYTATSCLGTGVAAHDRAFKRYQSGLSKNDFPGCQIQTWIGRIPDQEILALPEHLSHFDGRNNRLAWTGLQADGFAERVRLAVEGIPAQRVGLILGTSTSSIGETEHAYACLDDDGQFQSGYIKPRVHNPHSPSDFVAEALGISGPAMTISTACSSSAKVFASAARWMELGLVDAVLVGGVDSLCLSVLYGFHSLQLVSPSPCRPFDADRSGINIGEAAGFALLTRKEGERGLPRLLGFGESSDAFHMSSPHPEGLGATLAASAALELAGISADSIDYVNLHGTGTRHNDSIEGKAMSKLFPKGVYASSTKGWTGHTLGAAGILEAMICLNAMQAGLVPGTINTRNLDPDCEFRVITDNLQVCTKTVMSNSYGFGGNNCSLIFASP